MRNLLDNIVHIPRNLIVALITGYQRTLSPDHGPLRHLFPYGYCRHSPTCSQYAKERILERGVIIGGIMGIWRILRCNPFARPSDERILEVTQKAD